MTAEIYQFTGLTTNDISPKQVIEHSEHLTECVVVGIDDNGLYVAGSTSDIAESILLLERAKMFLLGLVDD